MKNLKIYVDDLDSNNNQNDIIRNKTQKHFKDNHNLQNLQRKDEGYKLSKEYHYTYNKKMGRDQ